jgi:hypothetical protein
MLLFQLGSELCFGESRNGKAFFKKINQKVFKNMRTLFTLLLLIVAFASHAQTLPVDETGKVNFTEVVEIQDSAHNLYAKALQWFAITFKSSNDVIQMKDESTGMIIGKGTAYVKWPGQLGVYTQGWLEFIITIAVKNGKYKYNITGFKYQDKDYYYPAVHADDLNAKDNKPNNKRKQVVIDMVNKITTSMKTEMSKSNW